MFTYFWSLGNVYIFLLLTVLGNVVVIKPLRTHSIQPSLAVLSSDALSRVSPIILEAVSRKTFSERLHWLPMVDGKLPPDAMIGGFENEHIYIARAYHNNSLCTGKYVKTARKAFVPWGGREHCKEEFEILCGFNAKWIKTRSNYIPHNAFIGGRTGGAEVNNEPLYIGRAMYDGRLICGKVYARYNLCYLPYKGREIEVPSYEILVIPDDEIPQAIPFTTYLPTL